MSTRSLLAVVPLNPRALIAHWRESTCATCRLVARRRASGRLEAPERRMSSCVMTWMAEAACDSLSGRFETEVTSRFISCSMLSFFNRAAESACWANPGSTRQTRPNVSSVAVAAAAVLASAIGRYPLFPSRSWQSRIIAEQLALLTQGRGDPYHAPRQRTPTWRFARGVLGCFCGTEGWFRDS